MKRKTLAAIVTALVLVAVAFADVTASACYKYHQNKVTNADDLHFTVYQKEPWVYIKFAELDVSLSSGSLNKITTKDTDNGVGDGRRHAIEVKADGTIPYCTWVTIKVKFTLNNWNTVRIKDVLWTIKASASGDEEYVQTGVPNHGFVVTDPSDDGTITYYLVNDGDMPLTVRNFTYAMNQPAYIDPAALFDWYAWTGACADFSVEPMDSFAITFSDIAQTGAYLFAKYDAYTDLTSVEPAVSATNVHQIAAATTTSDIGEPGSPGISKALTLEANQTKIRYSLPEAGHVTLALYSVSGEKVSTLVDEQQPAGSYTVNWSKSDLPAGLYIARLSAGGIEIAEKVVRIK